MVYLLTLIFLVISLFFISFFYVYNVLAAFKGSPYVPTSGKNLQNILKTARLRKGQTFIDLGCGDGRVVEQAVSVYGVSGTGVDVNLFLILLARLRCHLKGVRANFRVDDFANIDLSQYDTIFVFLMPKVLAKLTPRLEKLKKGTIIISHGFKLPTMDKYLINTLESKPFSTYFYKLS